MTRDLVVVCAFDTEYLYRMIRLGASVAKRERCALEVMFMQGRDGHREENAQALEYAYQCARDLGAELNAYYADDGRAVLRRELLRKGARYIVMSERKMSAREMEYLAPFAELIPYLRPWSGESVRGVFHGVPALAGQ